MGKPVRILTKEPINNYAVKNLGNSFQVELSCISLLLI